MILGEFPSRCTQCACSATTCPTCDHCIEIDDCSCKPFPNTPLLKVRGWGGLRLVGGWVSSVLGNLALGFCFLGLGGWVGGLVGKEMGGGSNL